MFYIRKFVLFLGMKHFLLPLLLLASCTDKALENKVNALADKVVTLESAQAVDYSRLDNLEQESDSIAVQLIKVKDKAAITDSLVQRRAFKRDAWGKAGAFLGGALGLKIGR